VLDNVDLLQVHSSGSHQKIGCSMGSGSVECEGLAITIHKTHTRVNSVCVCVCVCVRVCGEYS
jgi:hypothetical protein